MNNLLSRFISKVIVVMLALCLPVCCLAADIYSSTLSNQTKQYDPDGKGYTLQQVAKWGNDCVVDAGKQSLAPGETSVLKIKQGCEWAGVRYKMLKDGTTVGYVAQSFRNKNFSIEISLPCTDDTCTLTGLPPQVSKK